MTICPYAIIASCKKCPLFKMCPLKTVLGDHKPEENQGSKKEKGKKEK